MEPAQTLLGYIRDFVVAVIALLIIFGVEISEDAIAGILLLVTTAFALGSYIYTKLRPANPES